jgi:predicted nucleic acid-binding Zn ribbon protein
MADTDGSSGANEKRIAEAWTDFAQHREAAKRYFHGRAPKPIGKVLAQLVSRRGYAQIRAAGERDEAWQKVAGAELARMTQVSALRRGVFEVLVANSLLMQELTFRKETLLADLQAALPDAGVKQLKFKVGRVEQ